MNPMTPTPAPLHPAEKTAPTESAAETGAATSTPNDATGWENPAAILRPPTGPGELGRIAGFRILRLLGRGGMGAVFAAEETLLGRAVALKVMRPDLMTRPEARDRFMREAKAAAAVEHDHIIPVFQIGNDGGLLFIAMPLLQGETLEDRLVRDGRLTIAATLKLGREVADGLAAAHARDLIHRDIKPANLWLEGSGTQGFRRVKILDFGLARPVHEETHLTSEGGILGTPAYMSTEQAAGELVDYRTDLFSLGVVLYRCLTGELPFVGSTTMAILSALANKTPVPIREKNPAVPPALADFVMTLLSKNPSDRPQSATEVLAALTRIEHETLANSQAETVTLPSEPKRVRPQRRLRWAVAAVLFGLMVALAGVIVIKVRGPDGKETEVRVPEGSKVEVDAKGNVVVTLPGAGTPPKPFGPRPLEVAPPPKLLNPELEFRLKAGESLIDAIVILPDSKTVVTGDLGGMLRVWDLTTRKVIREYDVGVGITALALHPDGKTIAVACQQGPLFTWEPATGNKVQQLTSIDGIQAVDTWALDYTKIGDSLVFADNTRKSIVCWPLASGAKPFFMNYLDNAGSACSRVSPTRNEVAVAYENAIQVLNLSSKEPKWSKCWPKSWPKKSPAVSLPAFSSDGQKLAIHTRDGTVVVWNCDNLDSSALLLNAYTNRAWGLAFSPDNKRLVEAGFEERDVRLWDLTGSPNPLRVWSRLATEVASRVAFTPDGKQLLSTHDHGTISIFDVEHIPTWKPYPPLDFKWLNRVHNLTPDEQVKEVISELKRRNPGFVSDEIKTQCSEDRKCILSVQVTSALIEDIYPLQGFPSLTDLMLGSEPLSTGRLWDLSPLKDMKTLHSLAICNNVVRNLWPIKELPLNRLHLLYIPLDDLSPISEMRLFCFSIEGTQVEDISVLKNMPLKEVGLVHTPITDISALRGKSLQSLQISPARIADLSPIANAPLIWCNIYMHDVSGLPPKPEHLKVLRGIKTLKAIDAKTAEEFWKAIDATAPKK